MITLIEARNISLSLQRDPVLKNCSFTVSRGECIVITGKSGSGKTSLGKVIAGHYPINEGAFQINENSMPRVFVHQQHDFRFSFHSRTYFGQRYDRNYSYEFPTVQKILDLQGATEDTAATIIKLLKLEEKLEQPVIELSNGEGKRVQLAQALLLKPSLLVLDQPFVGLDTETRKVLHQVIFTLKNQGVTLVIISSVEEIPECIDHIWILEDGGIVQTFNPGNFPFDMYQPDLNNLKAIEWNGIEQYTPICNNSFECAIHMENVSIEFDGKMILDDISWTVNRGEHWALTGHNGSGKSTLLSLITGDNPQAYLNTIYLFDNKRGTGESVWDIKRKIGYVSPEMHNFFQRTSSYVEAITSSVNDYTLSGFSQESTTCYETVCSGFNDQMGSSVEVSYRQQQLAYNWIEAMELKHLIHKPFYKASLGEQRLLLLIRSLVKNPPLLILDEPCQGLDKYQTHRFVSIVDDICKNLGKTLIYVSHYETDLPKCIDKQLVLAKGRVYSNMYCDVV
ncbi:ATP-binding cassette domain-containing protein [Solitalea lacus]|uniref:ATP-binding cassette domain-containing protein n=1 Tax=Solitalea lacus TaxID=2911172 RepID=UPI001EDA8CF9|nr:ATP-binding cassette domain-containing protein [Solitalea lacus]UKJ06611.1 ATP-binding cassette domain-containing protein [Solitalea lacus]